VKLLEADDALRPFHERRSRLLRADASSLGELDRSKTTLGRAQPGPGVVYGRYGGLHGKQYSIPAFPEFSGAGIRKYRFQLGVTE